MHRLFFILIAMGLSVGLFSCKKPSERPLEGKIKREVLAFAPKVTGRIVKIYVQEGDVVKKGDTLAFLDVPEATAKLSQAQGVVMASSAQRELAHNGATENQLKQLRAKQTGIEEQFEYARKSYDRAKAMFNDSMMTPQAFDEATAKYKGARAQLDAVNAELAEASRGVRPETQRAAQGQANQALGVLQEVEVALAERYIIATNDMEIQTISLNVGELATAGFPLFNGYQPDTTYFRFTVRESKIGNFQPGQECIVDVPYAHKKIKGKITAIKQLARYADITAAYPDYEIQESVYEIKIVPLQQEEAAGLLANALVLLD